MSSAFSVEITFFFFPKAIHYLYWGLSVNFNACQLSSSLNLIGICIQNITVLILVFISCLEWALPSKHPCIQSQHLSLSCSQSNPLMYRFDEIFLLQNLLDSHSLLDIIQVLSHSNKGCKQSESAHLTRLLCLLLNFHESFMPSKTCLVENQSQN